jgi:hypothetical protein
MLWFKPETFSWHATSRYPAPAAQHGTASQLSRLTLDNKAEISGAVAGDNGFSGLVMRVCGGSERANQGHQGE